MKTKTLLLIGGGGLAAFALYKYMQGSTTTTQTLLPVGTSVPSMAPAQIPDSLQGWVAQTPASWQQIFNNNIFPTISSSDLANLQSIVGYFNTPGSTAPASLEQWWWSFANKWGLH